METPFGFPHHHHHHHHRRNDETDEILDRPLPPPQPHSPFDQPPPPPYYQSNEFAPPRPPPPYDQQTEDYAPPPPHPPTHVYQQEEFNSVSYQPPPPPPATGVSHVPHNVHEDSEISHHSFKPHLPSFIHSHSHSHSHSSSSNLSNKPTFKVYCKAEPNFALTIRDDKVVLAPSNPSDEFQNWYKDEKYSTRVKDEEGFPCFALVNKATGQAIKHSVGATHPVQLIPYNPDVLDESVLWSESKDLGDGYRAVRMINNIRLNVDAFHGDKDHGGVRDGTTIVLWEWAKGDNQRWRITLH